MPRRNGRAQKSCTEKRRTKINNETKRLHDLVNGLQIIVPVTTTPERPTVQEVVRGRHRLELVGSMSLRPAPEAWKGTLGYMRSARSVFMARG